MAVSGGKDSLALWDVLIETGYQTAGLYLDLGIFDYSVESKAKCEAFAASRGQKLIVESVAEAVGRGHPRGPEGDAAADLLGLRSLQALPHEPRGRRPRLPGDRDGPQPGRRGRRALRQRAPLADGPALAPVARARLDPSEARPARQAALPPVRAGDGGLRLPARHRLHRGRVPVRQGRHVHRPQADPRQARGGLARGQAQLPLRLPREGARRLRGPEPTVLNECAICGQVTTGEICAFCKLSDQVKRRRA